MPHRAALAFTLALVAAVCSIPLDEMSTHNDISGLADSSDISALSLPKTSSEDAGERRGAAVNLGQLSVAEGNGLSRVDGAVPGENPPVFIELDSDNVGQGGKVSSGNSSWLVY